MRGIHLQQHDPITRAGGGVPLLQPAIKLGISLAVLFVSFLAFAQSGRLYSHVVSLPEIFSMATVPHASVWLVGILSFP